MSVFAKVTVGYFVTGIVIIVITSLVFFELAAMLKLNPFLALFIHLFVVGIIANKSSKALMTWYARHGAKMERDTQPPPSV